MDKNILFKVDTTMEKEDYKKFLYIAAFRRDYKTFLLMLGLAVCGSFMMASAGISMNAWKFALFSVLLFSLGFAAICLRIELRYRQQVKADSRRLFGGWTHISFYNTHLKAEADMEAGKSKRDYGKFYKLIESKSYYIFYYSSNAATVLRKEDLPKGKEEAFRTFILDKFKGRYKKI
ncbi:YcxB family protein [Aminipila butyrica]|uniref:YcxB family protein n=1 Tax=Aminipila butyrica TaxID=433296 RepID=A0A858BXJ6_9FIRM|nr:YcxB family protein [Aminipila butyrica]QIB70142.1 YcxB family protein [Aminipila butyrica]